MEKQGVFYAVSVGPGDPELLTRQACRVLAACPVVAAPRMKSGRCLLYTSEAFLFPRLRYGGSCWAAMWTLRRARSS